MLDHWTVQRNLVKRKTCLTLLVFAEAFCTPRYSYAGVDASCINLSNHNKVSASRLTTNNDTKTSNSAVPPMMDIVDQDPVSLHVTASLLTNENPRLVFHKVDPYQNFLLIL
ncbi:hypothetical protein DFH29DRAFT_35578 [Suillus ampliporus]|nr:hypothetical protein DFH29DRAFT_35578 [Suillus ampliporus]